MEVKGLVRKGAKFQVQYGIPKDVRPGFGGLKKFTKMINTTSEEYAGKLALKIQAGFDTKVFELRQIALNSGRLTEERVSEIAAHIFTLFHEEEAWTDSWSDYGEAVRSRMTEALYDGDPAVVGLPSDGPEFERIVAQVKAMTKNTTSVRLFRIERPRTPLTAREEKGKFTDVATRWAGMTKRVTQKTIDQYLSDVTKFSSWYEMKKGACFGAMIRPEAVNDYVMFLMSKDTALATITRMLSACKLVYKFGQFTPENPFAGVKDRIIVEGPRMRVRRLTDKEVVAILKTNTDKNSHMAVLIAAYSGMRLAEIADVRIGNIVRIGRHRVFDLENAGKRKTEASYRKVPIHSRVWKELGPFVKGGKSDEYVLVGEPMDKYGSRSAALSKRIARLIDRVASDPQAREHSFRHTVISKMADAGVRKELRRAVAGHAGEDVHDDYTQREAVTELVKAVEKITYKN